MNLPHKLGRWSERPIKILNKSKHSGKNCQVPHGSGKAEVKTRQNVEHSSSTLAPPLPTPNLLTLPWLCWALCTAHISSLPRITRMQRSCKKKLTAGFYQHLFYGFINQGMSPSPAAVTSVPHMMLAPSPTAPATNAANAGHPQAPPKGEGHG